MGDFENAKGGTPWGLFVFVLLGQCLLSAGKDQGSDFTLCPVTNVSQALGLEKRSRKLAGSSTAALRRIQATHYDLANCFLKHRVHVDYGYPSISRLASIQTQSHRAVFLTGPDYIQTKGKPYTVQTCISCNCNISKETELSLLCVIPALSTKHLTCCLLQELQLEHVSGPSLSLNPP